MSAALQARGLFKRFGGLTVTDDVSLTLEPGARHALIGPNGAGKTTLVNLLTGVLRPSEGAVVLAGEDVTQLPQHARVRRGLARTFQITQLFPEFSPAEALAAAIAEREGRGDDMLRGVGSREPIVAEIVALLDRFDLIADMDRPTHTLAYGKQRLLEIALALACRPKALLLDEPVLLIEHDMDLVFSFAKSITVLVAGRILTEGAPDAIAADPRVRAVYLGEDEHG